MAPRDALVVDDDPDSRGALARLLQTHGYTVRKAENGKVALDRIAERVPCILLLDVEMPVMNGWEVLASLQRTDALHGIIVVVLSAALSSPPGVTCMGKPCEVDRLLATIAAR